MATMKLIVSFAILVIGTATLGSAQWRRQNGYQYQQYYPQQQSPYQNQYPKGQTGVSVADAEWVCKNSKTGDLMIIVAEDVPAGNGQGQWQQQRTPNGQPPVQPGYPGYPQQPSYPQPQPPNYPQPPTGPSQPTAQPPIQGTTPNTDGEGILDIRMGQR